jgi:hypothetical protein
MDRMVHIWRRPSFRIGAAVLLVLLGLAGGAQLISSQAKAADSGTCNLGPNGSIQHVISIQFDNVHFTRDNANVPSDLEQMPNLLNFLKGNGVLDDNQHTPLISHTANDIITTLTGLYPNHHGMAVANSFRVFNSDGSTQGAGSFSYWTAPLNAFGPTTDTTFNMLSAPNTNTPAPWVPFTRDGCNVGAYSTANMSLENIGIDIPTVFGAHSPEATEVKSNPDQAFTDFVGVSVHCAKGAAPCSGAHGRPDLLPSEPGGYNGYQALFGDKYVAPQISSTGTVLDLNGDPVHGVNGFDPSAAQTLGYVAAMQEHNVPVTYAYIEDAHDNHATDNAFGPGEAGYVSQLASFDDAFGKFFTRLAHDGINKSNTLFIFSADEDDHFVGGAPSPAGCDGVHTPCTYSHIGEFSTNLRGLLATEQNSTTPFTVHSDDAPNIYITGNPSRTDPTTRAFEQASGQLTAVNPITGKTDPIAAFLADPVEENLLHMVTADPARTPTFTLFGDPNYFMFAGAPNCKSPCVTENPGFAWDHGDVQSDITTTWLGMVGPGVRNLGVTGDVWSDHTDIRPTMLALLGLKDDYTDDGRVLFNFLNPSALPHSLTAHEETLRRLADAYKQINAPVNQLGLDSLVISTAALKSSTAGDSTYLQLESQLTSFTNQRNALAGQMNSMLENAAFGGQAINEGAAKQLIDQAQQLLSQVHTLAQSL